MINKFKQFWKDSREFKVGDVVLYYGIKVRITRIWDDLLGVKLFRASFLSDLRDPTRSYNRYGGTRDVGHDLRESEIEKL